MSATSQASSREVRPLVLYEDYTREDVHDIFDPHSPFTPQRGKWGIPGLIELPERPRDFVFFVTFGQKQGDHEFDEASQLRASSDGNLNLVKITLISESGA